MLADEAFTPSQPREHVRISQRKARLTARLGRFVAYPLRWVELCVLGSSTVSRRRWLSTKISKDKRVNALAMQSDFAALLYTWMIPHASDDATITGDAEELLYIVLPGRRDKTVEAIDSWYSRIWRQ